MGDWWLDPIGNGADPFEDQEQLGPARAKNPQPGQPCGHPGCLQHLTHPCEGCGRIGGEDPRVVYRRRLEALLEHMGITGEEAGKLAESIENLALDLAKFENVKKVRLLWEKTNRRK